MGSDPIMSWIVDSRNTIVKEGDLATSSAARASLLWSYLEPSYREFEVDPMKTTREIVEATVVVTSIPPELYEDGILMIERRWLVPQFPETELLDLLSHAHGVLVNLVYDAHRQAGIEFSDVGLSRNLRQLIADGKAEEIDGRPECMIASSEDRTVHIRMATGELMDLKFETVEADQNIQEQAKARYGVPTKARGSTGVGSDLESMVTFFFEQAKKVLVADGHHVTMVFLVSDSGIANYGIEMADQSEKYRLWNRMAVEVERLKAHRLILISEIWMAPMDEAKPFQRASQSPARTEALSVFGADMEGEEVSMLCPFENHEGQIILGEDKIDYSEEANFLLPVRKAWSRFKSQRPSS